MRAKFYVIIGGGLVGAASAFRLRAAGFDVTLIDPGAPREGASFGNIGHIAAEQCAPLAAPGALLSMWGRLFAFGGALDFRWRDAHLWGPWALSFARACADDRYRAGVGALSALLREPLASWRRLMDAAGAPALIQANGHVSLWHDPRATRRRIAAWRAAPIGNVTLRELEPEERAAYGACMKRAPAGGLAFTGTGQVAEPQAVRDALLGAFTSAGGRIVQGRAARLSAHANGVVAALEDGAHIEGEAALVAAGVWSRPLMARLGVRAPLIAERGYSIQSAEHAWDKGLRPAVFEERALVISRFTSGLRASSFVEFGAAAAQGDARKWRALARHLRELGVAFSDTPDLWRGSRPTLPDYLPAIGRLERHPRVLYAFGHQHLGLTLAAVTGDVIAALAEGAPAPVDLTPLRIERFA